MTRFNNKADLKNAIIDRYQQLVDLINQMDPNKQEALFTFDIRGQKEAHWQRDKNLRDTLIHVYEWQELLILWVTANQNGQTQSFLPSPYNWKTYGQMNLEFHHKHQNTTLDVAKKLLNTSHLQILKLLEQIDDNQLFAKNTYAGGSTIGQYFISATVSHYDWAMKKIKKHLKESK